MKIIIQNIETDKPAKHAVIDVDSFNVKEAVKFAIRLEYGGRAEADISIIKNSQNHHSDYVIITNVEYDGRGVEPFPMTCNGKTVYFEQHVLKRLTTKVRIEIKVDKLNEIRLNRVQNLLKKLNLKKWLKGIWQLIFNQK